MGRGKTPEESPAPYEPTERERATLIRQNGRLAKRLSRPKFKVLGTTAENGKANVSIAVDHKDAETGDLLFRESLATSDPLVASFLGELLAFLAEADGSISEGALNRHLAMVQDLAPRDTAEAMLACQMVAVHVATMTQARYVYNGNGTLEQRDMKASQLNKLARTFAAQMEALKRYRSKGRQKVTVEHKHYHLAPGAITDSQAVLGDVKAPGRGRGDSESENQSHERLRIPFGPSVRSEIEADRLPVSRAGLEGQAGMPVPRRQGRGANGRA
jgi:hypothetical protein